MQFALSNGRVIFTQDTDFLRINQLARCFKSEKFPSIRPNLIETIAHWLNNAIAEP
ncbi:hypothetical protein BH695_0948 [Microcystis aeruginosa PCC 7806SL]|uniref:DUF5615 domain-containing protein n=1 Tax=Microcystis aeruginosa PCC 7806SL TaxID=1903187 RepID=A0AB33BH25_MICA7|nr:hypothetical protein BH695_0948 [Microcystis aeruginosa PCC 7806SL]